MKRAIIFDVDGTLADISHRLHFIESSPKDWNSFFDAMKNDKPIERMRLVCNSLVNLQNCSHALGIDEPFCVVFCTGRPFSHHDVTEHWLQYNILPPGTKPLIYMRRTGDKRKDEVVKEEMIEAMREDGLEPYLAFEDRERVVAMWRRNGIPCCQVADGKF